MPFAGEMKVPGHFGNSSKLMKRHGNNVMYDPGQLDAELPHLAPRPGRAPEATSDISWKETTSTSVPQKNANSITVEAPRVAGMSPAASELFVSELNDLCAQGKVPKDCLATINRLDVR
jgi:hypothetical protein